MNRQGEVTTLLDTERFYGHPRLSPDGSRLALHIFEANSIHLWVYEIQRSVLVRLTFSAEGDFWPLWTPDGKRLTFASNRDGFNSSLYWKPADGSGEVERLTTSEHPQFPTSWSPDGTTLAFEDRTDDTVRDIWVFRVGVDGQPEPFLQTPFNETNAVFSPDGRWLAYESDESGTRQIYVRPFPGPGGKWQISTDGGRYPRWPADGNELFYRNGDKMMAAVVNWEGSSLQSQTPRELFATQFVSIDGYEYDVASDGERFVVIKPADEEAQPERSQIMFVLNWFEELKAKAPTGGNR
jgi:serine/threonine-protein kinase